MPIIENINANNSMIEIKNLEECKKVIFNKTDISVLDRHKVASCVCGAFLKVSIFNKQKLVDYLIQSKIPVQTYFYYVNEYIAFSAGIIYLGLYMISENKGNYNKQENIIKYFPIVPTTTKSKMDFLNNILFSSPQIKRKDQIGIDHYDLYAYSMLFFMLQSYFYDNMKN